MRIEEKEGSFIIVDFNDIEAYKIARKIENDGIVFYQNLKEKAKDKKMCETMDLLLQEEKRHLAFFENALFERRENNDESLEEDDILDEMDYGIFPSPDAGDTVEKLLESPEKAIGVGIVMENRSLQFYQACRENVSSEAAKEQIDHIIKEEAKHKQLLEDVLKILKNNE